MKSYREQSIGKFERRSLPKNVIEAQHELHEIMVSAGICGDPSIEGAKLAVQFEDTEYSFEQFQDEVSSKISTNSVNVHFDEATQTVTISSAQLQ